jgi:hypothetical protein
MVKPEPLCFTLRVTLRLGATRLDELGFQRRLHGHAAQRGLRLCGAALQVVVSSSPRTLSIADQAGLVERVISDSAVVCLAFGPLRPLGSDPRADWVALQSLDFCVCTLNALYRVGHLDAGPGLRIHPRATKLSFEARIWPRRWLIDRGRTPPRTAGASCVALNSMGDHHGYRRQCHSSRAV